MKAILKPLVPPLLWNICRGIVHGSSPTVPEDAAVQELKEQHSLRNTGLFGNRMRLRDSIEIHVHPDSRWGFEHFCFLNTEMVAELDQFLTATADCRCLLDVGALHGLFSLAFTSTDRHKMAIAVDASPRAFCKLLYHVHHNSLCEITPVEVALSDSEGKLRMSYEWEHAVVTRTGVSGDSTNDFEVPMTSGDTLCERHQFRPDCVKIDVEGHEVSVLRGLSGVIATQRPLIFLEVHPARLSACGESVSKVEDLLRAFGYKCCSLWGSKIDWAAFSDVSYEFRILAKPEER